MKEWWKETIERAIKGAAEAMLAYIGTGAIVLSDVNWIAALSAAGMGAVISFLIRLSTIPIGGNE
jgi:hypothetical protein